MITDQEYCWQDVELAMIDLQVGEVDQWDKTSLHRKIFALTGYWFSIPSAFCRNCGLEGVVGMQRCEKCYAFALETEHYI